MQFMKKLQKVKNKNKKINLFIVVLFSIIILLNAFYFLIILERGVSEWLTINLCTSASLITIFGFLTKSKLILNSSVPSLLLFGIGGLLMMGWDNFMRLYSQFHHITMILTAIYILIDSSKAKAFEEMKNGILAGFVLILILGAIGN